MTTVKVKLSGKECRAEYQRQLREELTDNARTILSLEDKIRRLDNRVTYWKRRFKKLEAQTNE